MRLASDSKLLQLAKQQFQEASFALSLRLPRWKYALDGWNALYREEGYYKEKGCNYEAFYTATHSSPDDNALYDDEMRFYVLELFKHVETFLTRLDRAFSSNPRPFALKPQSVVVGQGPVPPQVLQTRRKVLDGVTRWLCYDYVNQSIAEQQVMAMRDCLLLGTGYTQSQRDHNEDPYPRADMGRVPPWDQMPDPLAFPVQKGRYFIQKMHFSEGAACARWPDSATRIRAFSSAVAADQSGVGEGAPSGQGRKEILVLHYWAWLDPAALKGALDDEDLQDIGTSKSLIELFYLADQNGQPSDELLDAYPLPFHLREIPVQDYVIIRNPLERGPYGRMFAGLIMDGNEALNILFNRAIQSFEFSVLQGGFYDSKFGSLGEGLRDSPRPGEWRALPMSGTDIRQALLPMKYPDYQQQYQAMMDRIGREDSRYTAINDSNVGLSAPTKTNTLGEVSLLQNESNETFRFRAQRLDTSFRRAYRIHAQVAADVLKSWYRENPGQFVMYLDPESDQYIPLDPSVFDEPWEIDLQSGSTLVDGGARAQELLQMAGIFAQMGEPVQTDRVARRVMTLRQEDPDVVLGTPQEVAAQKQQQQLAQAIPAIASAMSAKPDQAQPGQEKVLT